MKIKISSIKTIKSGLWFLTDNLLLKYWVELPAPNMENEKKFFCLLLNEQNKKIEIKE